MTKEEYLDKVLLFYKIIYQNVCVLKTKVFEPNKNCSQVYMVTKSTIQYGDDKPWEKLKHIRIVIRNVSFHTKDYEMTLSEDTQIQCYDSLSLFNNYLCSNVGYVLTFVCTRMDVEIISSMIWSSTYKSSKIVSLLI